MMIRWRLALAVVLVLVGIVWVGQGTGAVAGSAMSGQSIWALVGGLLVVGGLVLGALDLIRKPVGRH
jgi:hypothetical protein